MICYMFFLILLILTFSYAIIFSPLGVCNLYNCWAVNIFIWTQSYKKSFMKRYPLDLLFIGFTTFTDLIHLYHTFAIFYAGDKNTIIFFMSCCYLHQCLLICSYGAIWLENLSNSAYPGCFGYFVYSA